MISMTSEELQLLRAFVSFYADFWLRQSVGTYEAACDALSAARKTDTRVIDVQEIGGRA